MLGGGGRGAPLWACGAGAGPCVRAGRAGEPRRAAGPAVPFSLRPQGLPPPHPPAGRAGAPRLACSGTPVGGTVPQSRGGGRDGAESGSLVCRAAGEAPALRPRCTAEHVAGPFLVPGMGAAAGGGGARARFLQVGSAADPLVCGTGRSPPGAFGCSQASSCPQGVLQRQRGLVAPPFPSRPPLRLPMEDCRPLTGGPASVLLKTTKKSWR